MKLYLGFERNEHFRSHCIPSSTWAERIMASRPSPICGTLAVPNAGEARLDTTSSRPCKSYGYSRGRHSLPKKWLTSFGRPRFRDRHLAFGGINPKYLGHSDQIGYRPRAHFPHEVTTMHLHGNLAEVDLRGNLFAHQPARN
jgi:hypothetical protein